MSSPIHLAITRRVKPGREQEFEHKLAGFAHRSLAEPGTRGVQLLHPAEGSVVREYGIVRSFASEADRDAFYRSELYQDWLRDIDGLVEGAATMRELHGLEAWFNQPDLPHPPRWKMAVATLIGVYPTSFTLSALLGPQLHGLPKAVAALIMAVCMVICLTWLVMPGVTKLLHRWLHPKL